LAKNLKFKIKNAQLAEALELDKKPIEQTKIAKVEQPIAASTTESLTEKPKVRKATALPKSFQTSQPVEKVEKPVEPVKTHAKAIVTPENKAAKVEEALFKPEPIVVDQKPIIVESAKQTVEPVQSVQHPPKAQHAAPAKSEPLHEAKTDKRPIKVEAPVFEEPAKKARDFKEVKPVKKPQPEKSFDSRDRLGLRASDDEAWKRRKAPKFKLVQKEEQIIRPTSLKVSLPITVKDLAAEMKYKVSDIITKLFKQGITVTINDVVDDETLAQLIGLEFGCEIIIDRSEEKRLQITEFNVDDEIRQSDSKLIKPRAPVVAFMGHVDHGKTSLIDAIRKTNVAATEAGAITQHIGAFRVKTEQGEVTILDTPGHEAFSAMRTRGATLTDVVVIVIAGDEGIKAQTDEAINQAKKAGVPIIVALNKCDKPNFRPEDVYRQLSERELLPEAWGGTTITVNCSATTKTGLSELLEMILLQAEILELKANPNYRARGTVIESEIQKGLGATATLLVQNGTLKLGDALVIDHVYGRVKTMHDEHGKNISIALPSYPVRITGLSELPVAGCEFIVVGSEKEARKLTEDRIAGKRKEMFSQPSSLGLDSLMQRNAERQEKKILNVIIKADVQGSVEAIKNSLGKIKSQKAELNIIYADVGEISESDIQRASTAQAVIIGFHTSVESHAETFIRELHVQVLNFEVIYHLVDKVKSLMADLLDKIRVETQVGNALVQATFKSSHLGIIAGCIVNEGFIKRSNMVKVMRNKEIIWQGDISSLKRVQEDVREVAKGLECGILLNHFNQIQPGDNIQSFEVTYIKQDL
jgi:translation initiation factor IF-2